MKKNKNKKTLIVNFYAGPGTGKSTTTAGVFAKLKLSGINCEMALEYAKEVVWSGDLNKFDNQVYIFAKQYHRIFRLLGKVDVILTDCPILMSMVYSKGKENRILRELVVSKYKELNNMDIFLRRVKPYNPKGRLQTKGGAKKLDGQILSVLKKYSKGYETLDGDEIAIDFIAESIISELIAVEFDKLR